jgi:leader peptidase (prepilin peptidase)/N-methyltransferase
MLPYIELFTAYPFTLYVTTLILGLLVGSFLNVVIYRLPIMLERQWKQECSEYLKLEDDQQEGNEAFNLVTPRSACPHCGHQITALENIPVLSYLIQKGKCRSCGSKISLQYPLIELLTGVMSVGVIIYFGYSLQALAALFFTWSLIALAIIDLKTTLLPDNITLPLIWAGLILNLQFGLFTDMTSSLYGAVAGYLSLWTLYHVFKILTGKEGMGYGDFKLFAAFGAWLGWQYLPVIIILSSFAGAAIGIGLILFRSRDRNIPIPFGPYLAIAGWIALIWGQDITRAYLSSAGIH